MGNDPLDVVGIGNAIVDVLAQASDSFIAEQELPKGSMTLIDMRRAESLYAAMGPGVEVSGGSCANTMAGLASLGGRGGFIGKVRNDQLGGIFRHDIRATGIEFEAAAATEGPPTARCLILVTPDAQRTMATYLGISVELGPEDVDHDLIRRAKVLYLEGYLWDSPAAKQAFVEAARSARAAGAKVATQTPPVRSGRRVVFLTLDDGTGPADATFFEDVQGPYAATIFHSWLLLVRGVVRRTGPRGVSIRATAAWELGELAQTWEVGGLHAAREHLRWSEEQARLLAEEAEAAASREATSAGAAGRRVLVHASGFRQSPYADIRPAGGVVREPGSKLWHSSPGSSGW